VDVIRILISKKIGEPKLMNLLTTEGSYRKGKATDTLVDKAIEGTKARSQNGKNEQKKKISHLVFYSN
jgi:hypothetical protein